MLTVLLVIYLIGIAGFGIGTYLEALHDYRSNHSTESSVPASEKVHNFLLSCLIGVAWPICLFGFLLLWGFGPVDGY